jgi:MFS family permease
VRATFVLVIYCGFSLGFVAAGLVSGWLIPLYGWRSMFVVGGVAPLLLVPVLIKFLPESPVYLLRTSQDRVKLLLRRIDRSTTDWSASVINADAGTQMTVHQCGFYLLQVMSSPRCCSGWYSLSTSGCFTHFKAGSRPFLLVCRTR